MKILIVSDSECDFTEVLKSCGAETECICFGNVLKADFSKFDSFCILPEKSGDYLEARFREKLEREAEKGKRIFLQAINCIRRAFVRINPPQCEAQLFCIIQLITGKKIFSAHFYKLFTV